MPFLALTIEKPAAGGRMIARHEGQVILVSGAIPGERVRARIERSTRHVAYAETVAVEEPSPDRREWAGDALCGGCLYGHIAYARQLELKRAVILDAFARIGHLALGGQIPIAASPEEGYRMRARLHVRDRRIGFFREATHDFCEPRQTRQLLPATCELLEGVSAMFRSLAIDSVHEIELAENADASNRVIAIDAATPVLADALGRIASIPGLTGVVSRGAASGDAHVTDSVALDGAAVVRLRRHVRAFFQGNRFLLSPLASHVAGQVDEEATVVDLYAGGGLFSIAAAVTRRARVVAVEGDRIAAADLAANAAGVPGVTAVHRPVEEFVKSAPRDAERLVAIVDPPRTGMSKEALDGLAGLRASRIVYVSCDVATLARDARRIVNAGYEIARLDAFDLFPNTPHVETVVVFSRADRA
jgi:23S rRNA (uracil1939-C5)-methyltransferase